MNVDAKLILVYTECGDTPRLISSFGPQCPIYAVTKSEITYRQLGLSWNIKPILITENENNIEKILEKVIENLKNEGTIRTGDCIVISGGKTELETQNSLNRMIGGILKV